MAKTENSKAAAKILNTLRDLTLLKNNGRKKNKAQKANINKSIRALEDEYLRLLGLSPDASYKDVSNSISGATEDLEAIVRDRKELGDKLVSATKLLRGIGSVLKLIA